jgi:hypothetical protein
MTKDELGREGALGLVNTGVEGGFGSVSCSTAGDYPSMGCQQLEGIGGRGDELLNSIPGGGAFSGRAYSDIQSAGELDTLSALLDSSAGKDAQLSILQRDTSRYAQKVLDAGLTDARCAIYAIIWCPTNEDTVKEFIEHRLSRGYDIAANLDNLNQVFHDEYADAADCSDYAAGYQDRADATYNYVKCLDLTAYGYPEQE